MTELWWGTYPPAGLGTEVGKGEGIYRQRGTDTELVLEIDAPSFVVAHPRLPILYAISESSTSALHVIRVGQGVPSLLATVSTGGVDACHLLLATDAGVAYICHYGSGDVAVVRLGEDGLPLEGAPQQLLGHEGSGPREDRQDGSHAHQAAVAPGGKHLLVTDLGTDELRRYDIGEDGLLSNPGIAATLPAGAGPRHMVVRGELIYVVCELDHHLRTLRWSATDAEADLIAEVPTANAAQRAGNDVYDGHIALVEGDSRDTLLVSVRGVDVISLFDLSPEGEARFRGSLDVGYWPRYFAAIGDRLHVGLEKGHEVRSYSLHAVLNLPPENSVGGMSALPYESASVVSPACVAAINGG